MGKSILKNILAKGTLNVFNLLIPFLVTPYVYRILNPEIMGNIEYGTTLFSYFGLFGILGIYNYGLRELSRYRKDLPKVQIIYKNLFVIGTISNLLFYMVYMFFVFFYIEDSSLKSIMYILGLTLISQVFSVEWVNESFEDFRFITIKTIIIRSCNVIAIFSLLRNVNDYLTYVLIITLYWFFNYIISFVYAQKYIKLSIQSLFSGLELKKYLVPLFFILILNNTVMLYTAADRTMLGIYSGMEQVAYYGVGQKIVEITKMLLLSIVFVTLPRLSLYLNENYEAYIKNIKRIMRLMLLIVLPVSIGLCLLSKEVVILFAGTQYIDAIIPLRIFAIRIIIVSVESILYNQIIFLHRKEKLLVLLNLLCGGINVGLNFLFLKEFTPTIAITTTLCAEILFQISCFYYIKKKLKISTGFFDKRNLKYLFSSLLFIPIILGLRQVLYNQYVFFGCSVLICILVYVSILVATKDEFYVEIKKRLIH